MAPYSLYLMRLQIPTCWICGWPHLKPVSDLGLAINSLNPLISYIWTISASNWATDINMALRWCSWREVIWKLFRSHWADRVILIQQSWTPRCNFWKRSQRNWVDDGTKWSMLAEQFFKCDQIPSFCHLDPIKEQQRYVISFFTGPADILRFLL